MVMVVIPLKWIFNVIKYYQKYYQNEPRFKGVYSRDIDLTVFILEIISLK